MDENREFIFTVDNKNRDMFYVTHDKICYKQKYSLIDLCDFRGADYDIVIDFDSSSLDFISHYDNIAEKAPILSLYEVTGNHVRVCWRVMDCNNSNALSILRYQMLIRGIVC